MSGASTIFGHYRFTLHGICSCELSNQIPIEPIWLNTWDDLKSPLIWLPGVFLSGIHMFSSWVCVFSGLAPIYKPIQTHVLWVHAQLVQPTTAETNVCLFNCSVATDEIRSGIVMKIWQGWSLFEKTFSQTALIDVLGGSVNNLSLELFRWIFF